MDAHNFRLTAYSRYDFLREGLESGSLPSFFNGSYVAESPTRGWGAPVFTATWKSSPVNIIWTRSLDRGARPKPFSLFSETRFDCKQVINLATNNLTSHCVCGAFKTTDLLRPEQKLLLCLYWVTLIFFFK